MNQSDCQFENAVKDLRQVLKTLRNTVSLKDLLEKSTTYERAAIRDLLYVCKDILEQYECFNGDHDTYSDPD